MVNSVNNLMFSLTFEDHGGESYDDRVENKVDDEVNE